MTTKQIHFTPTRRLMAMVLLLSALALCAAACGGGAAPAPAAVNTPASPVVNTPANAAAASPASAGVPAATAARAAATAPAATAVAAANSPKGSVDCAAADAAYQDFATNSQLIFSLKSDSVYAAMADPANLFHLDTTQLRADLALFATLPDVASDQGDKPSQIIPKVRQVLDLIDSNVKSGKPFSDGSGNGQKVQDLWLPLFMTQRASAAFAHAFQAACPNYTPAPRPTPSPQAFAPKSKAECAALDAAITDFSASASSLAGLGSDEAYAMLQPGSPDYVNIANLRADLVLFATLPDLPQDTATFKGKPSELVPQYRALLDLVESNVKSGGKPFSDGSGNGQKALDMATALFGKETAFQFTIGVVCQ